jgi:membrane protein
LRQRRTGDHRAAANTDRVSGLVARARRSVRRAAHRTWGRDRTSLGWFARTRNRLARLTAWTACGLVRDRLSARAAALTYYTVFSIVPVLAVALWIAKSLHLFGSAASAVPPAVSHIIAESAPLQKIANAILGALDGQRRFYGGLVGVVSLAYGVFRLIKNVDQTLRAIAGVDGRRLRLGRLLGQLVLFTAAPALVAAASLAAAAGRLPAATAGLSGLLSSLSALEVALAAGLPLLALWLVLALLYGSASPSGIPPRSAALGGGVGALGLAVLVGILGTLGVGARRASAVDASIVAVPVLMLWIYFSWLVVLLAAELAVGHALDRSLPRGVRAWRLDASSEQALAAVLAVEAARARGRGAAAVTFNALAGETGLPPTVVREVGGRLARRGLLGETAAGYVLACDPTATRLGDVLRAASSDPALEDLRLGLWRDLGQDGQRLGCDQTLAELSSKPVM